MSEYQLDQSVLKKIDEWAKKFPKEQPRSAVIKSLRFIQDHYGWLSDRQLDALAKHLNIPAIQVYEVASFYSMYHRKPVGRYTIGICDSISCMLCGSHDLMHYIENKLGVKPGETTKDGLFTLEEVECLAACTKAPVLLINGKDYYENMDPKSVDDLLEKLSQGDS